MTNKQEIARLLNTKDVENLKEILGLTLGRRIINIIRIAERQDKELDIVHACITKLYDGPDSNVPVIKKCLDDIQNIKP